MKQFTFICPFCNQKLDCDYSLNNKSCECPFCKNEIVPIVDENLIKSVTTNNNGDVYKVKINISKTKAKEYIFNFDNHNVQIINENGLKTNCSIAKFDMKKMLYPNFIIAAHDYSFYKNKTNILKHQFLHVYFKYILNTIGCLKLNSGLTFKAELVLYSNYITLSHCGLNILTEMGIQGEKYIPIKNITAIQIKPGGWLAGYIQFSIKGEVGSKRGLFSAMNDENTIRLTNEWEYYLADFIRSYILNQLLNN